MDNSDMRDNSRYYEDDDGEEEEEEEEEEEGEESEMDMPGGKSDKNPEANNSSILSEEYSENEGNEKVSGMGEETRVLSHEELSELTKKNENEKMRLNLNTVNMYQDSDDDDDDGLISSDGDGGGYSDDEDEDGDDDDEDEDEDEDEDSDGSSEKKRAKEYNPSDFDSLNVTPEIKKLFGHITNFTPSRVILEPKLLPFIPMYIPAVGELDPFLKPPRPDGKEELLGLKTLDEPAMELSNPTIVRKMVMMKRKKVIRTDIQQEEFQVKLDEVDRVYHESEEDRGRFEGSVNNWIKEIETQLHKRNPTGTVNYKNKMPDLTSLMQTFGDHYDESLKNFSLPSNDIDLSLEEYAKIICGLLDIPVYEDNIMQSLHLLFSLYGEFQKNTFFQQQFETTKDEEIDKNEDEHNNNSDDEVDDVDEV